MGLLQSQFCTLSESEGIGVFASHHFLVLDLSNRISHLSLIVGQVMSAMLVHLSGGDGFPVWTDTAFT